MNNEIIKILDDLGKRLGVTIDWSKREVMPYLEDLLTRFIRWEIVTSVIWGLVGIAFVILGIVFIKYALKKKNQYFGDIDEWATWVFILSCASTIIGTTIILVQCFDIVRAMYLPEMTVFDYINALTSQSGK